VCVELDESEDTELLGDLFGKAMKSSG